MSSVYAINLSTLHTSSSLAIIGQICCRTQCWHQQSAFLHGFLSREADTPRKGCPSHDSKVLYRHCHKSCKQFSCGYSDHFISHPMISRVCLYLDLFPALVTRSPTKNNLLHFSEDLQILELQLPEFPSCSVASI